ncbi:MAG: cellulase family glycosylhydrolase [Oscillospiraceae bacterium]
MKFKKIAALFFAVLMCVFAVSANVSAASAKKGIKLNKTKITLTVDDTFTLKPTVTGYTKYTVQWSTSDKTVATIKKGGIVTAKKAGTATITAKIKGTSYKATCKVTVTKKSSSQNSSSSNKSSGSAQDFVDNLNVGWNLGNTLDCAGCKSWVSNELDFESAWGNPKTTKAMILAVKKAGFNTIRIPVSWGEHMDSNGKISKEWLDRVQTVVDYAYDNDMYVILNTHHETGWIKLDEKNEKAVTKKFKYLWKQIAERFKDYDEKLIFEGLNEPRTEGSAQEWNGGTAAERKVLNNYISAFVDTVRSTGGNNKTRYLMLTPYGASSNYSAMSDLKLPDDDRIIISIHAYLPYNVALNRNSKDSKLTDNYKSEIDNTFSNINKVFTSKGIPVIIGEFGTINKSNTNERVKIAKYFLSVANKYGVTCCWWDNGTTCSPSEGEGFGLLNRKTLEWYYPEIVKALVESAK